MELAGLGDLLGAIQPLGNIPSRMGKRFPAYVLTRPNNLPQHAGSFSTETTPRPPRDRCSFNGSGACFWVGWRAGSCSANERYATAMIASTMIGTSSGEGPCPGAERACRPASPQSSTMRSLKPLTTAAFCPKPGAQWT